MADALCIRRLRREVQSLTKNPIDNIEAVPLESNIREWHFVIKGADGSAYEGGYYHGKLEFTKVMFSEKILVYFVVALFRSYNVVKLGIPDETPSHPFDNPIWPF
jgi:hypothetical protein